MKVMQRAFCLLLIGKRINTLLWFNLFQWLRSLRIWSRNLHIPALQTV